MHPKIIDVYPKLIPKEGVVQFCRPRPNGVWSQRNRGSLNTNSIITTSVIRTLSILTSLFLIDWELGQRLCTTLDEFFFAPKRVKVAKMVIRSQQFGRRNHSLTNFLKCEAGLGQSYLSALATSCESCQLWISVGIFFSYLADSTF